nr:E6 [human papillomavirus 31]
MFKNPAERPRKLHELS